MKLLFFAQIQIPPIDGVGLWAWQLIGVLGIVLLIMYVAIAARTLFGRKPSLTDALGQLATLKNLEEAVLKTEELKREMHLRARGIEEQVSALRHELRNEYQALLAESQDRREVFAEHVKSLSMELAALRERTEGHIRKLDMIEVKLDRVIERMVERANTPRKT